MIKYIYSSLASVNAHWCLSKESSQSLVGLSKDGNSRLSVLAWQRAFILMLLLLTPNTTIFFLILSGFLKITAPLRDWAYLSIHIKDRCPRHSNTLSVNNWQKFKNFLIVIICCVFVLRANVPGMFQRYVNQAPYEDARRPITLVSCTSAFSFPRILLLKHGYSTDFFSTPKK